MFPSIFGVAIYMYALRNLLQKFLQIIEILGYQGNHDKFSHSHRKYLQNNWRHCIFLFLHLILQLFYKSFLWLCEKPNFSQYANDFIQFYIIFNTKISNNVSEFRKIINTAPRISKKLVILLKIIQNFDNLISTSNG